MTAPEQGRPRARRTWPQRLLIATNILVIVACLATAGSLGYAYGKVGRIGRVQGVAGALTPVSQSGGIDHVENLLIVGTDSAEGLDPNDPVLAGRPGGLRSDTIMILRVDPSSDHAQLLSLPRDLWVPIDGQKGNDRINSAIQGGPERLVATIKNDFGIPINHYIEMNFFAFRKIVDAIGGVPIYFPTPVRDTHSLLDIPTAGCITLDPFQALAFARSRYYEYQDANGRWRSDPTGDFGRISRQQLFIRKVIQRAIEKGARNPVVLNDLIDAGTSALHLDPGLTPGDILSLGQRFKDFNPDNLTTYSVPATPVVIGGGDVLRLDQANAEPIFQLFRGAAADTPDSTLIIVQNGTIQNDLGSKVADELRAQRFSVPPESVGDADRFDYPRTVVRYNAGGEAKAQLVASYLVVPPVLEQSLLPFSGDVQLVVGADWQGIRSSPGPTVPVPGASSTTTTVPSTGSTAPSITTTTFGVVPQAPQDVSC